MSKDSLVKGTIILTVAALVARFLGVFQRIPLLYLLHDPGMATYGIAFNIYSILLVVATAGIPSALSKMISEQTALGNYAEANRIYRAAVYFALAAGLVMTVLLVAAAPYYAVYSKDFGCALHQALAPALLLFPLIAIMRGYFQGRQNMLPNGLSQVIEQILRVSTAIGLAYMLLKLNYGDEAAVAGASFGGVMGSIAAFAVMLYYAVKLRRSDLKQPEVVESIASQAGRPQTGFMQIYKRLFTLSIPIVLFSVTVTLIYFIDSTITIGLLENQMTHAIAKETLGVLTGRAQSLAGLPIILAIALSQSVVPIISSAFFRRKIWRE